MDASVTQKTTSSSSSSSQPVTQTQDKSQMWREKDAELHNDEVFAKIWEEDFAVASDDKPTAGGAGVEEKMLPLPTTSNEAGDKVFRFFWWDAFEDPYKQPGVVYLFGKVFVGSLGEYVSCCLGIKNVPRRIFLLPREYVSCARVEFVR